MAVQEYQVGSLAELEDGGMRAAKAGPASIVLARDGDTVYAVGGHCTHYGAPLEKGVFHEGKIHCPWHKACFRASDGALLQPPAMDSLPSFPVRIDGDDIFVSVPDAAPDAVPPVATSISAGRDDRTFVIVGAGAAGDFAAQELRAGGYRGRLILISREDRLPYDRTKLSKPYLAGQQDENDLPLRPASFYADHAIERVIETVRNIDVETRTVTFDGDRDPIVADELLIATGSSARKFDLPGADLGNIYTIRVADDTEHILNALPHASRVVVVGDGFISMEAAASLTQRGLSVTLITRSGEPLRSRVGAAAAGVLKRLQESKGVTFVTGDVVGFDGDGSVSTVRLKDGSTLDADLVVYGVGAVPNTGMISGVKTTDDGGIPVDMTLRVADGVWAAGDIAAIDRGHGPIRVEHWRFSEQLGWVAADQMLGKDDLADQVPYFWTNQFGMRVDVAGLPSDDLEWVIDGDPDADQPSFVGYGFRDGMLRAAVAIKRDDDMIRLLIRWQNAGPLTEADIVGASGDE